MQEHIQRPTADTDSSGNIKLPWPKDNVNQFTEINPGSDTVVNPAASEALQDAERFLFQRKSLDY